MELLPHQVHRAAGTVEVTLKHIARVKAAQAREQAKAKPGSGRSSKWPTVRKKFVSALRARGEGCAACGAKVGLQVHHVVPFHTDPTLELRPSNLIALCEYVGGLECHDFLGHPKGFQWVNPGVRADAAALLADPTALAKIRARARSAAVKNTAPPTP